MAEVFLSFVDEDRGAAMQIARALCASGIDVARHDPRLVPPDGRTEAIARAFASARCVVVLWSSQSVRNDAVLDDADDARGRDALVSVVLGEPPLPLGFRDAWYADLTQWNGNADDERFLVLKRLVEARLSPSVRQGPAQPHTPRAGDGVNSNDPSHPSRVPPGVTIRLRNGDLLDVDVDAIAVQYPQRLFGLVDRVVKLCAAVKRPVLLPQPGAVRVLERINGIAAKRISILGVAAVQEYDYPDLRAFARRAVTHLASIPEVQRIALPVYGPRGYRLDETKAFEAEIGGVLDALEEIRPLESLNAVALVEQDIACAERLTSTLAEMLARGVSGAAAAHGDDRRHEIAGIAAPMREGAGRARLFLCYRRQDTEDAAGRLYDRLAAAFGADRVFMDIDSVPLGIDFVEHVTEQITKCSAVIVMIGKQWLTIKDKKRRRRLDSEDDLVRAEIRAALQQKVPVIPVIVQNASMPHADDLPVDIRALARRNGIYLRSEQWREGVERLLRELEALVAAAGRGSSG